MDVTIDQYPYTASSTSIASALLPAWALEGGQQAQLARFKDPAVAREGQGRHRRDDPRRARRRRSEERAVRQLRLRSRRSTARRSPTRRASAARRRRSRTPPRRRIWIVEQGGCQGIFHAMSEDDLVRILQPSGDDGRVGRRGADVRPRPIRIRAATARSRACSACTCARSSVLTLEDAVRKMTSFPAARIGLADRGVLRPGMKADIAVFDPATRARSRRRSMRPHQYAEGFSPSS